MRRIAVYGKGGIGKSTISANLTAALSERGKKVMQIGCDPKHDSTRLLMSGKEQRTVLAYLRDTEAEDRRAGDVAERGYGGCICVEAGGPEPGVGCAGRGIISAFELLDELGVNGAELDITIYDVLGDVVCGGFAVPLRNDYADTVYIVTSGEFMSIYAANNILRGTANYNPDRIGGIIFNSRGDDEERERVMRFADAVGVPVIAEFSRSKMFLEAERMGKTVVEAFPDSDIAKKFFGLADKVAEGKRYTARPLSEPDLEAAVLGRTVVKGRGVGIPPAPKKKVMIDCKISTRSTDRKEVVHGCAFAGTLCTLLAVDGLTTVLHAPRDCAHFAVQMMTNSSRRTFTNGDVPMKGTSRPDVRCTDMSDPDMIFGSVDTLESAVRGAIADGKKVIAVVTSCPSGLIGEDVDGMVARVRKDHPDAEIIPLITDGNIRGDYIRGATDACTGLIRALAKKGRKERSVNLVGMKNLGINTNDNVRFVSDTLAKLGIKGNCTCIGNTDVEMIRNIPSAELCILLTPDSMASETMDLLRSGYGLAQAENIAMPGLKGTELWIREAASHFGTEDRAEQVISDMRDDFRARLVPLREGLEGTLIYIVGLKRDISWLLETAIGTGAEVVRCVVMDALEEEEIEDLRNEYKKEMVLAGELDRAKYIRDRTERVLDPFILAGENASEWIKNDLKELRPDLLLSMFPLDSDIKTRFIPVNPDITPFAGPDFAAEWVRMLRTPAKEGWRKDVVRI